MSCLSNVLTYISIAHTDTHMVKCFSVTSALGAVAGPATVPVVGVEHGDVATLVLQIHLLLQLLQRLVHTHVGVGKLCTGRREREKKQNQWEWSFKCNLELQTVQSAHSDEQENADNPVDITVKDSCEICSSRGWNILKASVLGGWDFGFTVELDTQIQKEKASGDSFLWFVELKP